MNKAGVYTSRTGSTRLTITIDGEEHYFGIYTLIETVDQSFLTKRYGNANDNGNLYKCLWGNSGPATLEPVDEKFTGNPIFPEERVIGVKDWETHYRPTYDLKTNEDIEDHTELLKFIDNINTLSGVELKDYLDVNFEVDRFLRYQAMNMLIGKWDDYWAMGNNYYLYFNNGGKILSLSIFKVSYILSTSSFDSKKKVNSHPVLIPSLSQNPKRKLSCLKIIQSV